MKEAVVFAIVLFALFKLFGPEPVMPPSAPTVAVVPSVSPEYTKPVTADPAYANAPEEYVEEGPSYKVTRQKNKVILDVWFE